MDICSSAFVCGGIYSIIDYVVCKVYFLMDQVDHVIC